MQIHSLPEQQTVADSDMFALDTGTTTRRTPFSAMKSVISDYAHKLTNLASTTTVNNSDVLPIDAGSGAKKITYQNLKNKIVEDAAPTYTSGDAASPTAWSNVTVIASGISLGTLLNRITTMVKNVRWIYSKLGTTDISGVGNGTVTDAISTLNTIVNGLKTRIAVASSSVTQTLTNAFRIVAISSMAVNTDSEYLEYVSDGGIRCLKDGRVLASGFARYTGVSSGSVYLSVGKYRSNEWASEATSAVVASPAYSVTTQETVFNVQARDIIYLRTYSTQGVGSTSSASLKVEYF